ncbi:hypothetical protein FH972_021478 [Carpinus fangiana]|uniref:Uncharacterized protein n=1 Tax=Carpinus fangiana TaxID=176857 RepID=A0A5N6KPT6_9ROSI|nr:hypothetical protein FH972_021478 [Carpinus fangiana]
MEATMSASRRMRVSGAFAKPEPCIVGWGQKAEQGRPGRHEEVYNPSIAATLAASVHVWRSGQHSTQYATKPLP